MKDLIMGILAIMGLALMILFIPVKCQALDRCIEFKTDVRIEHTKQFGPSMPWWYGIGQLKQESCCRANVTAFDAGQGVAQFMPKTAQYIQSLMGEKLDPYNPHQAIRMQAFYMARIHHRENWTDRLWISYQIYNGGAGLLRKESLRAGEASWDAMHQSCKRKVLKLKNGNLLDLCTVNYDYSQRVYKYGQLYRTNVDGMKFW